MNSKYEVKKLGDYIVQVRGISYKPTDISEEPIDTHMAVLRANSIKNNKLILEDLIYVNKDLVKENQIIKENDILIAASSGSKEIVGKSVQIKDNTNFTFGAFCKIVRCSEKIEPRYVGYFLRTPYYRSTISNLVCGANINNLKNEHIDELLIPMPSREIQQKVVNILDKSQELIDKRKKQIEALDELVKSQFIEMFGDPITNRKGWEKGKIADIIIKTQYGTSNKANEENGQFKILRMGNITYNGQFDFSDMKYIDLTEDEQKKYLVYKGEVLFNRTNSKELVGKTAVYKENKPMAYAGYLVKAIPNERATGEFIAAYMNTKYVKSKLLNMAKNIVGMANINAEEFKKIDIYIPPIELQNEYIKFIEQVDKLKFEMEKSLKELEDNFNFLMQRAFKGELFN